MPSGLPPLLVQSSAVRCRSHVEVEATQLGGWQSDARYVCVLTCDNLDELEMDGPVAYDCPYVPTCSEAMEYLEKYEHFL
jgi:hypothetical protein